MALEDIFRALEEQAQSDCDALLEAARSHADSIDKEASASSESICARCVDSARIASSEDAAKKLNAVRLESHKQVATAKENAVEAVFAMAKDRLASLRGSPGYEALFQSLFEEALDGTRQDYVILVDSSDEALARKMATEKGVAGKVQPDIYTMGGLVVSYAGGRILRRNTLEDRLEKAREHLKANVAEILFS